MALVTVTKAKARARTLEKEGMMEEIFSRLSEWEALDVDGLRVVPWICGGKTVVYIDFSQHLSSTLVLYHCYSFYQQRMENDVHPRKL